jgi:aminoglycoside phosphotransferase (APT) family kinase protein
MTSLAETTTSESEATALFRQSLERLLTRLYTPYPVLITSLEQLSAGASAETWIIAAEVSGKATRLVLRREPEHRFIRDSVSKSREVQVQRAALAAGVPVPGILHEFSQEDDLGVGYLMECIEGEALPQKILREARFSQARTQLVSQFGRVLASIHQVPAERVAGLPCMGAREKVDRLRSIYRELDSPSLPFDFAFHWLDKNIATIPGFKPVLVHGDFRLGNVIVDEQGIRCILDWELCHLGDPMEDLAYLCVNAWRFGRIDRPVAGLGQKEELYQVYTDSGGVALAPHALDVWEVIGNLHWGLICLQQACKTPGLAGRSLEQVAIGRRVSEVEFDLLQLISDPVNVHGI